MSVLPSLASALGSRSSEANIALAQQIASSENHEAIDELIVNLRNKDNRIQGDCIKTLYEIGYIKPELIADYHADFLGLLSRKNNRMVWSGMIALLTITDLKSKEVFAALDLIMETVQKGSVITIDCGVGILAKLNCYEAYFDTTDPLLLEQLWKCPIKQLASYAEKAFASITDKNREAYRNLLEKRKGECKKATQMKRLQKVLNKIAQ
ncbi:hypothetical protein FK220_010360 [Flavobacteriaceae bacterium TP-CH-4]|uniref:Uncharacterized protein n=1 Tax=Pelagihabitans pacificus TaxID=2696054 RepID=A0A967EAT7_9FLAO|nr:hypothetical protein [Pelagihabitans pacificus]NHF59746.1 hypothetical protein [Pelagihabitans pacificus]